MKIIKILLISVFFAGCATYNVRQGKEPSREYPVFLQNGLTFAAFKASAESKGDSYNALLTLRREKDKINVKLSGDFGYVFLDADFKDGKFTYNRQFWAACPEGAQDFFEEIIKVLTVKPDGFVNSYDGRRRTVINFKNDQYTVRYYFKKGVNFPYKMEQIKLIVGKTFEYKNYKVYGKSVLPKSISLSANYGFAKANLALISTR